jgi:hypothetical protein
MMRVTWWTVAVLSLLAAWTTGCEQTVPKDNFDRLNQSWLDTLRENRDLTRRNEQMDETIGRQNLQITELQHLGDKRLEKLFYVTSLELGRRSGGVDKDGQDGDDGVIVYVQPIDRDGNVIKAAGDVTVQLYDLANPPAENLIGEYHWSVDELGPTWAGGFLGSSQFSLLCPWRDGPPVHDQITIRATFTDYLTGKTFTAQKAVTIHLPGAALTAPPSSAPAKPAPSPGLAPTTMPASEPTSVPSTEESL